MRGTGIDMQEDGIVAAGSSCSSMSIEEFRAFREIIHSSTGIWLRDGKQVMLASRLGRRLRHHALTSFFEYYQYLRSVRDGGREMGELINCVTTNKTSFFREDHHFTFLAERLVPELRKAAHKGGAKTIRIWSAACSTGEEAYSIVIALREALGSDCGHWKLEVVASDIDTVVLRKARAGIYDAMVLAEVDQWKPALPSRYFLRGIGAASGQVKLKPEVMRQVTFQQINLMDASWQLEGQFDAIFFRNALIYFKTETQEMFLRRMLKYLRSRGFLLLGHSEHVPWLYDAVSPLPKTVYQLRA